MPEIAVLGSKRGPPHTSCSHIFLKVRRKRVQLQIDVLVTERLHSIILPFLKISYRVRYFFRLWLFLEISPTAEPAPITRGRVEAREDNIVTLQVLIDLER